VQFGAGEAALFVALATTGSILVAGALVVFSYMLIEWAWSELKISGKVVEAMEYVIEN
ncbi:hypothetical protein Q8348_003704, partial [Vibrio cholerae]